MIKKPNRVNKRKNKKGSGCAMCKPHKHKWTPRFKKDLRDLIKCIDKMMTKEDYYDY